MSPSLRSGNMTWSAKFSSPFLLPPNLLSYLRGAIGLCLPAMVGSPSREWRLAFFGFFIFAVLTDHWDGLLARRYQWESKVGRIIDPTMDKILVLVPLLAFSKLGLFSVWWLVPIFLREIVITFIRIGWMMEGKAIGAEKLGKIKFVTQAICLGIAYFYFLSGDLMLPQGLASLLAGMVQISIAATAVLTVVSGITFLSNNKEHLKSAFIAKYFSALGVGFIPVAPGFWGSLVGLGLAWATSFNSVLFYTTFLFLLGVGYWAVSRLDLSRVKDPQYIVIDEACGMFVTLAGVSFSHFPAIFAGLLIFRILDMVKPFPIRRIERLPGYWGIMGDDLAAGLFARIVLYFIYG